MKLKEFEFDGVRSGSFGLWLNGSGVYNAPDPDVEYYSIAGRSGDLIFNNNRFLNIPVTYPGIFMPRRFVENFRAFKAFLLSHVGGYFVLKDDYQPGFFRLASIDAGLNVSDIKWSANAGRFDLSFNCKPHLYLDSGAQAIEVTGSKTLVNPTPFAALPRIRVYGAGQLAVGSKSITIAASSLAYVDIDSELQDCYSGFENANPYVTFGANDRNYPVLPPGNTNIQIVSGISKVEVFPRWWTV